MAHTIDDKSEVKAVRVEQDLTELVKTFHTSDPMRACIIRPVIEKKAHEYHALTGQYFSYSLDRPDLVY